MQVGSLGWEDPLEEGTGNPLRYSFWGNPMDRGAWQATVHGVTESQTRVQGLSMHSWDKSVTLWGFWKVLVMLLEICP